MGAARLDERFWLWRPVQGGLASGYAEVRDRWTLHDLADAHLVLDFRDAGERAIMPKKKPGQR